MFVNFEKIRDYDCSLANKIVTVANLFKRWCRLCDNSTFKFVAKVKEKKPNLKFQFV